MRGWDIQLRRGASADALRLEAHTYESGVVVGTALVLRRCGVVYLYSLGVVDMHRSRGIGKALLQLVEDLAEQEGKYGLLKDSIGPADPLAGWYRRRGWLQTSQPHWLQYIPKRTVPPPPDKPLGELIVDLNRA